MLPSVCVLCIVHTDLDKESYALTTIGTSTGITTLYVQRQSQVSVTEYTCTPFSAATGTGAQESSLVWQLEGG